MISITITISGVILFIPHAMGSIKDLPYNFFFIGGVILIIGITIAVHQIKKFRYNQRIHKIIESYKGSQKKEQKKLEPVMVKKGWGMNNSPFRERKSGITWGGGHIKGASASRGSRKSFLK